MTRRYRLLVENATTSEKEQIDKLVEAGDLTLLDELPSVTTISGSRGVGFGMVHSAWKIGMEGKNYRDEWDTAAAKGTELHEIAEDLAAFGLPEDREEWIADTPEHLRGYAGALLDWWGIYKPEVIQTEFVVCSLQHRFAGRADLFARTISASGSRMRTLVDYKTVADSAKFERYPRAYVNNRLELVARARAMQEQGNTVERLALVRLAADGKHHHYQIPNEDWDSLFDCFLRAREEFDFIQIHDPPYEGKSA